MTFIEDVARLTKQPSRVASYWPLIDRELSAYGINTPMVRAGVAATVYTETGFKPVAEYPNPATNGASASNPMSFWRYEPGTSIGNRLGNTKSGDGYRFRGRGFVQLTGRYNYTAMANALKVDLVNNPDIALDPIIAARITVKYFKDRPRLIAACESGDWETVRRQVNGGLNGYDVFRPLVVSIASTLKPTPADVTAVRPPVVTPSSLPPAPPLGPMPKPDINLVADTKYTPVDPQKKTMTAILALAGGVAVALMGRIFGGKK